MSFNVMFLTLFNGLVPWIYRIDILERSILVEQTNYSPIATAKIQYFGIFYSSFSYFFIAI